MKTTNNEQYKKTDLKLKETFISFISGNEKSPVTVKDLCRKCGINRSTFYAHFEDINALMDSLLTDMLMECIRSQTHLWEQMAPEEIFTPDNIETVLEEIKKHKILYLYYMEQNTYHKSIKHVEQFLNDIVVSRIKSDNDSAEKHLHYYYAYVISGMIAVINEWLLCRNEETAREIAEIICRSLPVFRVNG